MSVIVKGIEMPKYCYDCPLQDGETGMCNRLGITVYDYIPKQCPLVELVRCKDCWKRNDEDFCPMVSDNCYPPELPDDWFCKDGERSGDAGIH